MGKGKYLKKAKVSTGKKVLRVVLVILLVLVLLVGAVFAFVWSKLGKITYVPGNPQETVANVETIPPVENPTEAYVPDETVIAILEGTFALIKPVITSTDGLWVAITRWIPAALAN